MHTYKIIEKGKSLPKASKALVLLHGRGSSANDIISLADHFCDQNFYIAAPQATNNTWYPYSFMEEEEKNQPWLNSAIEVVNKLIDDILKYIKSTSIYIIGFSQGACLTLEVVSIQAQTFAGVAAFTGGLIGKSIRKEKYKGHFSGTPVFIGNSDIDPHVPLLRSQQSKQIMEDMGAVVSLQVYPNMPHIISPAEINYVKRLMF